MRAVIQALSLLLWLSSCTAAQNDQASADVRHWSHRLMNEIPSSTFDTDVERWGKENGLVFTLVDPSEMSYKGGEYLMAAKIGRYKVSGFACPHHDLYAYVWLNQFKNSGSVSVERKEVCE